MSNSEVINTIGRMCGMAYDIEDEENIMKEIKDRNFDIEFTSQFADIICVKKCPNEDFIKAQLVSMKTLSKFDIVNHLNPTSFGNIACIIKNAHGQVKADYMEIYDLMRILCQTRKFVNIWTILIAMIIIGIIISITIKICLRIIF